MSFRLYIFLVLCAVLTACETDLEPLGIPQGNGDFNSLTISVLTDKYQTKSVNFSNTIPNGHSIGLFMKNVSESDMVQHDIQNVKFTASATELGQDWSPDKTIYLTESLCNVHAYYPYNEAVTNIEAIPVESTSQTDYMYAGNTIQVNAENRQATLELEHALSVITLNIKKGSYAGIGKVTKVGLRGSGISKAAKLNGKTGELYEITGSDEMLTQDVDFTLDDAGQTVHTLFVPNPKSSHAKISLWVDGAEYFVISPGTLFNQGYRYEYTLTVDNGSLDISAVNVGDWGYDKLGNPVLWAGNHRVTLQGDLDQLVVKNTFTDGTVSIEAKPFADIWVPTEITATEGASVTKTVDSKDGSISLRLSDITSDITVTLRGHGVSLAGDVEKLAFNSTVSDGAVTIEARPVGDLWVSTGVSATEGATMDKSIADDGFVTVNLSNITANTTVTFTGYVVTFAGDYIGIAFDNCVSGSTVTIRAINYLGYEPNEVSASSGATLSQSVDLHTRLITLSDIASNVTVTFSGILGWPAAIADEWSSLADGVYAIRPDLKPVNMADANESCIGVALINSDKGQKLMIEKYEAANSSYATAASGKSSTELFYWGEYGKNQSITDYTTSTVPNDYNGKVNSEVLKTVTSGGGNGRFNYATIGAVLNQFISTSNDNQGYTDWFIPACGQLYLIYQNMRDINTTLSAIGGTQLTDAIYWSSSEYNTYEGWYVYMSNGSVGHNYKYFEKNVRLVRCL